MELLYLWIDNYRDFIVKQGFNFSSEYRFDYNSESGELKIEKNLNYIDNFFNLDKTNSTKINNITAIIGENGAGKSSILDFIKDNLVKGDNGFLEKAIMVLEINGKYYLYYNKDININLQVKSDVLNFDERIQYETLYKRENVECYKWNTTLNPLSIIYFSNIFDGKYEISGGALYNISTNFLIKKDKRLAIEDKLINYEATESEVHRLFDINRQIRFINEFSKINIEKLFKLPKEITVQLIQSEISDRDLSLKEKYKKAGCYEFLKDIKNQFSRFRRKLDITQIDKFRCNFYETVLNNFFYDSLDKHLIWVFDKEIFDFNNLVGENILEKVMCLFETMLKQQKDKVETLGNEKGKLEEDRLGWLEQIIEFIKFIDRNLGKDNIKNITDKSFSISIIQDNNEKKEKIKFEKIFEYHSKAAKNIDFFNFDWRDLSSGEKALLNIYSRFYSLVDHNLEDNLIILIDEGELYLHPQWQKRFIYDLIEILPEIYPNKYIHIILTSHSPFVASDLPSSNIIFLKKDEKGRCKVVDGLEENNRTFGANIHTLFSDSFFMKDGLMGDFAKHKINELIKLLLGDTKKIKEKKDYIQSSINIIGEPVIRTKLLNMLKEKLEVDLISLDERIANLERELDELKRKKAND